MDNLDIYDGYFNTKYDGESFVKADHKHDFKPCVITWKSIKKFGKYKNEVIQKSRISSYCVVCGLRGYADDEWFYYDNFNRYYTEKAKKQLDTITRSLPTFVVRDFCVDKFDLDSIICPIDLNDSFVVG